MNADIFTVLERPQAQALRPFPTTASIGSFVPFTSTPPSQMPTRDRTAELSNIIRLLSDGNTKGFLRNSKVIQSILSQHPELVVWLEQAREVVRTHFAKDTRGLILEGFVDPEAAETPEVYLLVRTPLPVSEALDRLNRVDDAWEAVTGGRANNLLTIDVEYC